MKFLQIIFLLLVMAAKSGAYTMRKGVPNAWIDPAVAAPARPSPWTTPTAGYYYVDWNTGTDSGRTYGTPSAPRQTIPNFIPAGSRVELAAGNYGGNIQLITEADGTGATWSAGSAGPVWLIGQAGLTTVLTNQVIFSGNYFYIDGLKWLNPSGHLCQIGRDGAPVDTDHVLFRNCEIDGQGQTNVFGLIIGAHPSAVPTNHIIVYECNIHSFGNMAAVSGDPDESAIATGAYVYDVWVLEGIYHSCTAGIRMGSAQQPFLNARMYVAGIEVYNMFAVGLTVKYCDDVVFSSNHIHDIIDTPWSPSKCVGAQYKPKGLWIMYNRMEAERFGIYVGGTDPEDPYPVYVIGNIISGARQTAAPPYNNPTGEGDGAIQLRGSEERYIINNTLFDNCAGFVTPGVLGTTHIHNNIISNITEDRGTDLTGGFHIFIGSAASDANTFISNNLYYDNGTQPRIRWNDQAYTPTQLRANTAQGDNDLEGDPLFTNAATGDFTLGTGSPAIDTGSATVIDTLEALYLSTFGVTLAIDHAGNGRPANAVYDMGAYEFGSTFADTAPPTLISATINTAGTTITFAFNEAVPVGAGGSIGWALSLSTGSATVAYSSGTGTSSLVYTLSSTVNSGITGTVSYTQPGNGIEDGSGNDLTTLTGFSITNNSTAGGGGGGGGSIININGNATIGGTLSIGN